MVLYQTSKAYSKKNRGRFDSLDERRPRHLRLLIAGDSVSRYQYLSLIYYLRHGVFWLDDTHKTINKSIVCEREFENWPSFFQETNMAVQPYEWCDCYRDNNFQHLIEARYYHDPEYDNYVYFWPKFGNFSFKGRWLPEDLQLSDVDGDLNGYERNPVQSFYNISNHITNLEHFVEPTWRFSSWENLGDYIAKLGTARPTHVLINSGLWGMQDWSIRNFEIQDKLLQRLRQPDLNITVIYKITTQKNAGALSNVHKWKSRKNVEEYEKRLCAMADHCFDTTWTAILPQRHYWDSLHFHEPVYQWINQDLLQLLANNNNLLSSKQNEAFFLDRHSGRVNESARDTYEYPHTWTVLHEKSQTKCLPLTQNITLDLQNNNENSTVLGQSLERIQQATTYHDIDPCYWYI
jgi:hypothetical protein